MKNKLKNILIPIDLSDTALNALNTAIQMAKRHQAALHLLYIQDIMDFFPDMGQLVVLEPVMEELWEKDMSLLEKIVLSVRHTHQVNCTLHIKAGYRTTVITEQADALNINLIVLGTDTDINERSYLTDSLPYKILQNADSHWLTVPSGKEINNFEHIIFPVMSRENSINKLLMSQAVIAKNKASVSVIALLKKRDLDLLTTIRNISDQVKRRLKTFAREVTGNSVFTLNIAKDLTGLARDTHAQLVVVSGDTNRNLKEFFWGSFTQRMIRNAEVAEELPSTAPIKEQVKVAYTRPMQLNY